MPDGFSVNKKNRGTLFESYCKTDAEMKIVRALNEIYSFTICDFCTQRNSFNRHAIWDCEKFRQNSKTLRDIFLKYDHTFLMDYSAADLRTVHRFYKTNGFITG